MFKARVGEITLSTHHASETKTTKATIGSLYEQYYDRIVRYIYIRINDQDEAENLGGDVFMRAMQSFDSYRGGTEQIRSWLFKIAHNLVVDYLREKGKRTEISIDIDEIEVPDKLNVEEAAEARFEVKRLSEALKHLTSAQREVIGLRFFGGLSSNEVGKMLGKKSGAVREMQRAAIETLRKQMYV